MKQCFTKTLSTELATNKGLRTLSEAEMNAHVMKLLGVTCLKSLGIDPAKDSWAALIQKQTACSFSKAMKNGCADPFVKDRRKCAYDAGKLCLIHATELHDKAFKVAAMSPRKTSKTVKVKTVAHSTKKKSAKRASRKKTTRRATHASQRSATVSMRATRTRKKKSPKRGKKKARAHASRSRY